VADHSKIEWTDATWNIVTGCSVVSPGCTNCYAMKLAGTRLKHHPSRAGLTIDTKAGPVWNGEVKFNAEWLLQPLRWRRPRKIFVCAHGDLFHEKVTDAQLDQVFAVMVLCPQHTFQVLTKRPERMRKYFEAQGRWRDDSGQSRERECLISDAVNRLQEAWRKGPMGPLWDASFRESRLGSCQPGLPLPNVWLGTSCEDQARADERIAHLLETPAAVRFVSCEPLLGPIDFNALCDGAENLNALTGLRENPFGAIVTRRIGTRLDWVIVGGESGPGARPMHPDAASSLRDQCAAAGVPFFFKQWGEWAAPSQLPDDTFMRWDVEHGTGAYDRDQRGGSARRPPAGSWTAAPGTSTRRRLG
jgi:protein gp37